jgi:hypothetical protein
LKGLGLEVEFLKDKSKPGKARSAAETTEDADAETEEAEVKRRIKEKIKIRIKNRETTKPLVTSKKLLILNSYNMPTPSSTKTTLIPETAENLEFNASDSSWPVQKKSTNGHTARC